MGKEDRNNINKIFLETTEIIDFSSKEHKTKRLYFQDYNSPFFLIHTGYTTNITETITRTNANLWCVEYVTAGEGTVVHNDRIYQVHAGDVFILHSGAYHSYKPSEKNPYSKIHINANGLFIKHCIEAYKLTDTVVVHAPHLRTIFEEFYSCASKKHETISEKSAECALVFLKLIQALSKVPNTAEYTIDHTLGKKIKNYIDKNNEQKISLNHICEALYCSKPNAIRAFHKEYGMTPYEYMTEKRLTEAKQYLTETNLSIARIAEQLHFCNSSYFNRFFKRETGVSPNTYRKEHQR